MTVEVAVGMVLGVAQTLFAALQCKELKEFCSKFKYDSQLEALRGTVETIQKVLLDADSRQLELNNQGLDWVNKLKDAVYEADDLFDKFATVAQQHKRMPGSKISKKVHTFFSSENRLLFGFRTCKEIKEIRKKLDGVAKDHTQFGFSDVYRPVKRKEETWSYVREDSIIGRDADKEEIMGVLLRESDSSVDSVSFVSIVGIGGLGKTALAQLVYNDVRINDEFDLKLWVCVSDDFIMQEILCKMLKSATAQDHGDIGAEGVQNKVRHCIEGKKYFLILDDLWNESRDEWLKLRDFLQVGARGSRVVVTTRSKRVAGAIGDYPMFRLSGLSDDDSWHLFKRVAFNRGSREIDDDLVDLGKNIVKECANVPLAIRVVGSMLYGQEKSRWKSFQRIGLSKMVQGEESIIKILKFSYSYLEPQLKSCFIYCALFPKDYEIEKELLIRLWSAQGYLEPINDMQNTEDVGEEYFSILLQRCFFQDVIRRSDGEIYSCKMHDLIHDLAQEIAGKESYLMEDTSKSPFDRKSRHLAISVRRPLVLSPSDTFSKLSGLRTLLRHRWLVYESQVSTIIANCRRLRVLDLHSLRIKALPSTIKNLLHLRYLDLSHNKDLETLPESISRLYNLQVLNLRCCFSLEELPKDLRELVNLKHLDIIACFDLGHMPIGMDRMTGLRTLTRFVLGPESSKKGQTGQLRDLVPLINLRGTLEVIFEVGYTYDSMNSEEEAYLSNKEHIKALTIQENALWHHYKIVDERLLERLEPHRDLIEMTIFGYKGVTLPRWAATLATTLPRLVSICMRHFHDLQHLPAMNQLQHLKTLVLTDMPNVELMESDNNVALSFPSLVDLTLKKCPRLESFPRCPRVKTFDLLRLNEALTFCEQRDDEANATTPAASSFSASSSSGDNDNNSAGVDVFDLLRLTTDNLELIKSLFGESIRSIGELNLRNMKVESLSSVEEEYLRKYAFSIRSLRFNSCRNLKSLSGGGIEHLTNLACLNIWKCPNLELEEDEGFPWKDLHALSVLELESLPQLIDLPKGIQYLTSLQSLSIQDCEDMKTHPEWPHCPKSLRTLSINYCPELKSLPEAILPSLTRLRISLSNGLKERYDELNGTDFSKISHIPDLSLEF
ncbi:putative disease resistance protein RGA1 [Chenopodium quinoa]|uniref:Uncharacterized protein n=1 Tax=Chenopodium quinoa TaxID=63459 RepID=A0A803L5Y5_CHEQI|nr:putative disease resistance protein RGA1 [Chenopodium quinoa]